MTKRHLRAGVSALNRTWAAMHLHWRALTAGRAHHDPYASTSGLRNLLERRSTRRLIYGGAAVATFALVACGTLWWRLTSGPLSLDMATPWLTSAVEERLGGGHRVEVGGTQLERDDDGRTALRLRDIVVRDRDGAVIASAPKAEVGLSGTSLLAGRLQATRLSLIGARMAVRVDPDGQVNVFAGAEQRPIAAASPMVAAVPQAGIITGTIPNAPRPDASGHGPSAFAALLAWFDSLDALGFDGRDLTEVGLKNGSLVVDDSRSGKRWAFDNINFSLTRPREGGVAFAITSTGADGPWSLTATVQPRAEGRRVIDALVRDISPKDVLLALRVEDDAFEADMPISAALRAEIGTDGTVHMANGTIIAGAGFIGVGHTAASRILVDEVRAEMRWDPANRVLLMPVQAQSGANQVRFVTHVQPPRQPGDPWALGSNNGFVTLGSAERTRDPPLVLDRINVRARIDTNKRRIDIEPCDLVGMAGGVSILATIDYAEAEPRLSMGVSATRMTMLTMKRLWPAFIVPPLRAWVIDHFPSGTVEKLVIATNAPWNTLKPGGPPVPDGGMSGEIAGTVSLRPVDTLPAIRDADLVATFTGRTATVALGRGTVDLPSGRKITVSNGTFEVPDTAIKGPPSRLRLKLDGPADAAIELASMEPLRGASGVQLDAATTRGNVSARLDLSMPLKDNLPKGAVVYNLSADVTNFSAEKMVRGLKKDEPVRRVHATHKELNAS